MTDLARCPFCSYAEVYPPVSANKEFKCRHPECEIISCRQCNRKTHIPMTCTEAAAARSADGRHKVEEAMSNAVIRKCNRCGKEGNCHLYDDVKDRHARETREAENAARTPLSEATNAKHAASDLGFEFSL
ncbi:hypothetical protein QL093DRAFT_2090571 [Fusarium oxysporum]|nr:hypothetical protein QL093DRAFT_2090571 [Fusarium oxysporum]